MKKKFNKKELILNTILFFSMVITIFFNEISYKADIYEEGDVEYYETGEFRNEISKKMTLSMACMEQKIRYADAEKRFKDLKDNKEESIIEIINSEKCKSFITFENLDDIYSNIKNTEKEYDKLSTYDKYNDFIDKDVRKNVQFWFISRYEIIKSLKSIGSIEPNGNSEESEGRKNKGKVFYSNTMEKNSYIAYDSANDVFYLKREKMDKSITLNIKEGLYVSPEEGLVNADYVISGGARTLEHSFTKEEFAYNIKRIDMSCKICDKILKKFENKKEYECEVRVKDKIYNLGKNKDEIKKMEYNMNVDIYEDKDVLTMSKEMEDYIYDIKDGYVELFYDVKDPIVSGKNENVDFLEEHECCNEVNFFTWCGYEWGDSTLFIEQVFSRIQKDDLEAFQTCEITIGYDKNEALSSVRKIFYKYNKYFLSDGVRIVIIAICYILDIVMGFFCLRIALHKKEKTKIDNIPIEIVIVIFLFSSFELLLKLLIGSRISLITLLSAWTGNIGAVYSLGSWVEIIKTFILISMVYLSFSFSLYTILRRIKKQDTKSLVNSIAKRTSYTWKITFLVIKIFLINAIIIYIAYDLLYRYWNYLKTQSTLEGILKLVMIGVGIIAFIGFWLLIDIYYILREKRKNSSIQNILYDIKQILKGNGENELDVKNITTEKEKRLAIAINELIKRLKKAIKESFVSAEKSMKNKRLKAELITNVSNDIEESLMTIIDYIDLLKQKELNNPRAEKYLEVLENKSKRLKMLTEDLEESSTLSDGNIELDLEILDFRKIIELSMGDFYEKYKEKGLNMLAYATKEKTLIYADKRRIFRVVDNLLQNAFKYSVPNTDVYIKLDKKADKIILAVENVSIEKININPEELKERFVRGDSSRTTEGSGLGLAITDNFVKLHKGELILGVDGEKFKATVILDEFVSKRTNY